MKTSDDFFLYWATGTTFLIALMIQLHIYYSNKPEVRPIQFSVYINTIGNSDEASVGESDAPWLSLDEEIGSNYIDIPRQIDHNDFSCLATNIYHEARGSSMNDQVATAQVVLNRVTDIRWPGSICEVVWQEKQFSWTHDTITDIPEDQESWERAQWLAMMVLSGITRDETDGADHYHTSEVNPAWSSYGIHRIKIGNHEYMRIKD